MLTPWELDAKLEERARIVKAGAATPLHSACEAGEEAGEDLEARRRRERVQHLAEPTRRRFPRSPRRIWTRPTARRLTCRRDIRRWGW